MGGAVPSHAQLLSRSQMSNLSGGIEAGGLMGNTELDDKLAAQLRAFVRLRVAKTVQSELGLGYGRMAGEEFGTDMLLMDLKVMLNALEKGSWTPLFVSAGLGLLRYDLDKIVPGRTALAEPTGWSAMIPIEAGTQVVVMRNVGFEVKIRYSYVFTDDINSLNNGHDNDSFRSITAGLVLGNLKRKRPGSPR